MLAGLKMDLNRPFGNGRDDNGNSVVDEPDGPPSRDDDSTRSAGRPSTRPTPNNCLVVSYDPRGQSTSINRQLDMDGNWKPATCTCWPCCLRPDATC